jgi:hypothetical protein
MRRLLQSEPRTPDRITVYYVPKMRTGAKGLHVDLDTCGGDALAIPPVVILNTSFPEPTTMAHELGHGIGLEDQGFDPSLLSYGYSDRTGTAVTPAEKTLMRRRVDGYR